MGKYMSRRELLKAGLVGALMLGAEGLWRYNRTTLANVLLEKFPETLPGAREINKYELKDANKTLVHVIQSHLIENISKSEAEYVRGVQKDIYHILDYLNLNQGVKEVYDEGITLERAGEFDKIVQRMRLVYKKLGKEKFESTFGYLSGGGFLLEAEGRIKLLPVETAKGNNAAQKNNASEDEVYKNRENIALEIISRNPDPLNVVIYGGAHWFGDNINNWNSEHPGQKYSLIEVIPESYGREE